MTAKILSFPDGKHIPKLQEQHKKPVAEKIAIDQTKKYANAVADDMVIGMLAQLQQEGMNIGIRDPKLSGKTFLDLGIFMESLKGLLYRELGLKHPFHEYTNNLMYRQKDEKTGRTYSVIDYQGKKIVDREDEDSIEFEGVELNNDTDRLQPDSDK